jgi:MFS family permease
LRTRPIATTVSLLVATFLSSMDVTVVGTALPRISGVLGRLDLYPWVFSIFLLTSTVTVPIWGKLADQLGRKPCMLAGISILLAGSLACGAAPSMPWLVAARAVQGLGAAAIPALALTIFGDIFPVETRARMQGIFSLVWGVSAIVGPALGGAIVHWWSWRWVFYINLPVGAVAMALFASAFHEKLERTRKQGPLLPLDLFNDRVLTVAAVTGFLTGPILFGYIAYVPLYLQGALGIEPLWAGLCTAPMMLAWTTGSFGGGRLILRFGFRPVVRAGTASLVVGNLALWLALQQLPSAVGWLLFHGGTIAVGLGMGSTLASFIIAVQERATWERRGVATALVQFLRSVGATVGVTLLGALLTASLAHKLATVPGVPPAGDLLDPSRLAGLPPSLLAPTRAALATSVTQLYLVTTLFAVACWAMTFWFPHVRAERRSEALPLMESG